MSPPPDASEITAPKDPAEYRPKPLMGATFWAMIALILLCVLAGVAITLVVPRVFGPKTPARSAAETSSTVEAPAAPATSATVALAAPPATPAAADVCRNDRRETLRALLVIRISSL